MNEQTQADKSFVTQTREIMARELELLRKARGLQLTERQMVAQLDTLRDQIAAVDRELVDVQHILDGIGLGQKMQTELIAAATQRHDEAAAQSEE